MSPAVLIRAAVALAGLVAFRSSALVAPVYRARPDFLTEPGVLIPPGLFRAATEACGAFALALILETLLRRRRGWAEAFRHSVVTSAPVGVLAVFFLAFVPGAPGVPDSMWWLLIDARPWLVTLVVGSALYAKLSPLSLRLRSTIAFAALVATLVVALVPDRRFSQPYDARWGTGDEPRYVRITASLLHDGDAEIGNAEEHIGRTASPWRFARGVVGWAGSAFATARELVWPESGGANENESGARYLGGPVIQGRDGGLYYAFLPGFPLLLVPSMAVDSYLDPSRLSVTLATCLLLGVLLVVLLARLLESFAGTREKAFAIAAALGLTLPLYFYHYQVYTEVTAAICVTLTLRVLLGEKVTPRRLVLFALVAGYLPWLHGKYLPIWGVAMAALAWRGWRDSSGRRSVALALGLALTVPTLSLALNCLYVFHITGSIMPDALWVMHGYERSGMLVSRTTLPGLHYLFLGRIEGLFVYAPHLALAIPGLFLLWRDRDRGRYVFVVALGLVVPYVLAAASHDQGGAGAWSPPGRYLVPVVPVFALALARWLTSSVRWTLFLALAAGSFWIGQGMLAELNFPYDRPAFLASLVVDPSPALESAAFVPLLLAVSITIVSLARCRLERYVLWLVVVWPVAAGAFVSLRVSPPPHRVVRLRASPVALELTCDPLRLRATGTSAPSSLDVRGPGLARRLIVPSATSAEIDVPVSAVVRYAASGRSEHRVVTLALGRGEPPVDVDARCR